MKTSFKATIVEKEVLKNINKMAIKLDARRMVL